MSEVDDHWIDITHVGSLYEIQLNTRTDQYRHRPLHWRLPIPGHNDMYAEQEWAPGLPPKVQPIKGNT